MLSATRTVPIVFPVASDPVAAGFVESLARPGGNATGFMDWEYGMAVKWPELLKQIAPSVTRVAVLRDPAKCLTVTDECTKEGLAIDVAGRIRFARVIEVLSRLVSERGAPMFLRSDNGPEFVLIE